VDVVECIHSIPQYNEITSVQPMYTQRLSEFAHFFLFTPSSERY